MKRIGIIFRKELKDMLRDRRTIFFMVIFPILIIPILIGGIPKLMSGIIKDKMTSEISIAVIGSEYSTELVSLIDSTKSINLVFDIEEDYIETSIRRKIIDGALKIPDNFVKKINSLETAQLEMFYLASDELQTVKKRLGNILSIFINEKTNLRMKHLEIDASQLEPIQIIHKNLASNKEQLGNTAGGWLPYMFILYCFMGAMYPALDLGAGEKERGTIETLLASPAGRLEILIGKFGVIFLFGFMSAIFGILGLSLGFQFITEFPSEIMETAKSIIQIKIRGVVVQLG